MNSISIIIKTEIANSLRQENTLYLKLSKCEKQNLTVKPNHTWNFEPAVF